MPAPDHVRVTWSGIFGTLAAPQEIWSMSLAVAPEPPNFYTRANLQSLVAPLSDCWVNLQSVVANNVHLTECTVAAQSPVGGRLVTPRGSDGAYIQGKGLGTALVGTGTPRFPLQVSLACSLQSDFAGPTGRGRFYLPGPALAISDTGGRISTTDQSTYTAAVKAFVNAVNGVTASPNYVGKVCIASGGSASQGVAAGLREVKSVKVGRAYDTQRRRRGDLNEEYLTLAL